MSKLVKQIMIAALLAVALLGGSELPILHAPQFAEAHAFAHEHLHPAPSDVAAHADAGDHDHSSPAGSDHSCNHVHAHCCAAMAILVDAGNTQRRDARTLIRVEAKGAIPYGELSHPPLRPPRRTV